jgi:concanavalin A-like lectin/glucanase superfamily protein/FecR-like protein
MTDPTLLISRYFDEDLSAEEFVEFSAWLAADIENARLFARRSMMEHHLCECHIVERAFDLNESIAAPAVLDSESETASPDDAFQLDLRSLAGPQGDAPSSPPVVARRRFPWRRVAAVMLPIMVAAGAWTLLHTRSSPATLTASVNAEWITAQPKTGERLPAGTLELGSGLIEVKFVSGASMIVEGPAKFRIRSENSVVLDAGHLTAVVPERAHGFTVQTPSATVVDLGTEFGVGVESGAATHLEVFRGKITAGPLHTGGPDNATRTVTVNQTADVTATVTVVAAAPSEPSPFVRKEEFDARVAANKGSSYERWLAYSYQLRRDPDLVAYYTFDNLAEAPKCLLNRSYLGSGLDGILGAGVSSTDAGVSPIAAGVSPIAAGVSPIAADVSSTDAGVSSTGARVITNIPFWTTGRWPQKGALAFDTLNHSRIALPSSADDPLDFSGGGKTAKPFTVAAWICAANPGSVVSKGPALAEQFAIDVDLSNHLRAWIRDTESDPDHPVAVIDNSVTLDGARWVNLAMTYDPSARSVRLYIDGALVGENIARSGILVQTVEPVRIGAHLKPINAQAGSKNRSPFMGNGKAESSTFGGRIDELSIFRRAISADQVKEMYESGRPD